MSLHHPYKIQQSKILTNEKNTTVLQYGSNQATNLYNQGKSNKTGPTKQKGVGFEYYHRLYMNAVESIESKNMSDMNSTSLNLPLMTDRPTSRMEYENPLSLNLPLMSDRPTPRIEYENPFRLKLPLMSDRPTSSTEYENPFSVNLPLMSDRPTSSIEHEKPVSLNLPLLSDRPTSSIEHEKYNNTMIANADDLITKSNNSEHKNIKTACPCCDPYRDLNVPVLTQAPILRREIQDEYKFHTSINPPLSLGTFSSPWIHQTTKTSEIYHRKQSFVEYQHRTIQTAPPFQHAFMKAAYLTTHYKDKWRRPRTVYSLKQQKHLEQAYKKNKYLRGKERKELCKVLNLEDRHVKVWYQNRRAKERGQLRHRKWLQKRNKNSKDDEKEA